MHLDFTFFFLLLVPSKIIKTRKLVPNLAIKGGKTETIDETINETIYEKIKFSWDKVTVTGWS